MSKSEAKSDASKRRGILSKFTGNKQKDLNKYGAELGGDSHLELLNKDLDESREERD